MSKDLIPSFAPPIPGGQSFAMMPGVKGDAAFHGKNECYRSVLWRWWGRRDRFGRYALFIGMNPSSAGGTVDDRTVRREITFTAKFDLQCYMKMNVMDYRATYPKDLFKPGVVPCSDANAPLILANALGATKVVAAWGKLPRSLQQYAIHVENLLRMAKIPIYCLGTTKEGFPRHPLYVDGDTPFQLWIPR
jgi:hypothetical protein